MKELSEFHKIHTYSIPYNYAERKVQEISPPFPDNFPCRELGHFNKKTFLCGRRKNKPNP